MRSCRATKLAANYGRGWRAIVLSITPSIHGHFDPLKLIREREEMSRVPHLCVAASPDALSTLF